MSDVSTMVSATSSYANQNVNKTDKVDSSAAKKTKITGKTIGEPELSDNAAKYYEQLKKKYSNMDFILVSADQKENAKSQVGNFANVNKMVVLIDEDKIEKMAEDEKFRKQYEGIISNAASGLSKMAESISSTGANVKGYGIQVNDNGTTSFFAVVDKSLSAQKDRIEKKAESKREAKKTAEKKAAKEETEERLNKSNSDNKAESMDKPDTVTLTANSLEELLKKINDTVQAIKSDNVETEDEKKVGKHIDFSI